MTGRPDEPRGDEIAQARDEIGEWARHQTTSLTITHAQARMLFFAMRTPEAIASDPDLADFDPLARAMQESDAAREDYCNLYSTIASTAAMSVVDMIFAATERLGVPAGVVRPAMGLSRMLFLYGIGDGPEEEAARRDWRTADALGGR